MVLEVFRSTSATAPAERSATGDRNAMYQGGDADHNENPDLIRLILAIIGIVAIFS
jgi:hypothetical protein